MTLALKAGIGAGIGVTVLGMMIGSTMRKHGAEDIQYGGVVLTLGVVAGLLVWILLALPESGWDW